MDLFSCDQGDGVLNTRLNILNGQGRVVTSDDLLEGKSLVQELEDVLYCDARARYAGLAEMDVGVDNDPLHFSALDQASYRGITLSTI